MSCPDWGRLVAHRRAAAAEASAEPEGWHEALDHLGGCDACRGEALAAEPVLLFRGLPTVEADAATLEEMRAGVAALRRARRVAGAAAGRREKGRGRWWGRTAAAAVLAAGLLGLRPDAGRDVAPLRAEPWSIEAPVPIAYVDGLSASTVDDIERPTASVYHIDDEEIGVVMVVDAGLDV